MPVRVLVAHEHAMVRTGIRTMLRECGRATMFEVGEAETSEQALGIAGAASYAVVLLQIDLPGRGGVKATELLLARDPRVRVLGLGDRVDRVAVQQLMRAGAKGFLLRDIESDTLVTAIRTVIRGGIFYSNEVALRLMEPLTLPRLVPLERLSRQEKEVLIAILRGEIDREIADRLGIGKRTVDKHRQRVKMKLGARNTVELVLAGIRLGLVQVNGAG